MCVWSLMIDFRGSACLSMDRRAAYFDLPIPDVVMNYDYRALLGLCNLFRGLARSRIIEHCGDRMIS